MQNFVGNKIKAVIVCYYFPKWYEKGDTRSETSNIELLLSNYRSLDLLTKKEIPYNNSYLVIDERNLEFFFKELTREIINKHDNINSINLYSSTQHIYNLDLSKEISDYYHVFDVSSADNIRQVHKNRDYQKYFNRNVFVNSNKVKKPFLSEYIGFTGISKDELQKGVELKCELLFENSGTFKTDYIFIQNIIKLKKKWSTGPESEYYVMPKDFLNQVNLEFKKLLNKNKGIIEIRVKCNLFDDNIIAFDKDTSDNLKFERNIEYFYLTTYKKESGTEIKKQLKRKSQTFIESNRTGNTNSSYKDLEERYGYLDMENDHTLDDLRSDFYSGI